MSETTQQAANDSHTDSQTSPQPDFTMNDFRVFVLNEVLSRSDMWRSLTDPRRNIWQECGHPQPGGPIDVKLLQQLFDRDAIANRIVKCLPAECWQVQPEVFESEKQGDEDEETEFEEGWRMLGQQLRGENSWYQDDEGGLILDYLRDADEKSGIGRHAIILIGIEDGLELAQPAKEKPGSGNVPLKYLRVFPESQALVSEWDVDPKSDRFLQPVTYQVTFGDPRKNQQGAGMPTVTTTVHWSRVVHVSETGASRLEPVVDRVLDLQKMYGGCAEMYWRGALPGWSLETHPQLGGQVRIDEAKLKAMMQEFGAGLQRYLALSGMTARSLAPQVVDPTPQIAALLEAICIQIAVPIRVFKGSERGELASSQDDAAWNDRLRQRQNGYITPHILIPFIDRLITLGVLPEPEGYSVEWPDLTSQTESEKASIANQYATAINVFTSGAGPQYMAPVDFWSRILGFTDEEATAIIDNATEFLQQKEASDLLKGQEQVQQDMQLTKQKIDEGLMPDPTQQPPGRNIPFGGKGAGKSGGKPPFGQTSAKPPTGANGAGKVKPPT